MTRDELLQRFATPRRVLDHGHVALVDVMGDDERIEAVARLSYGDGTRTASDRRALIRYLVRHRHTSPLEQVTITLDVKLPIFVARQLVRHRMQSLNEVSARYSVLPAEFYVPDPEQVCHQSQTNKQGRAEPLDLETAAAFREELRRGSERAFGTYDVALTHDVARETARIGLPLGTYTHWWTTWDLHNLLHMLQLRLDAHAQWEIRVYAEAIADIVKAWVPLAWEAFEDYRLHAATFSRQEMAVLRQIVDEFLLVEEEAAKNEGRTFERREVFRWLFEHHGVETQRERTEFVRKLKGEP